MEWEETVAESRREESAVQTAMTSGAPVPPVSRIARAVSPTPDGTSGYTVYTLRNHQHEVVAVLVDKITTQRLQFKHAIAQVTLLVFLTLAFRYLHLLTFLFHIYRYLDTSWYKGILL